MASAHTTPELLAPAGDREALRAAVANGADAVYFGLTGFNARARAANFTPAELPELMRFLHGRNVRGFVALERPLMELIADIVPAARGALILGSPGREADWPAAVAWDRTQHAAASLQVSRSIMSRVMGEGVGILTETERDAVHHSGVARSIVAAPLIAFDAVYGAGGDGTLIMIGDPKQAIYAFRGADIFTYLAARRSCGTPASSYYAKADPVTAGGTGTRYFATDTRGTLFYTTAATVANPIPSATSVVQ